MTTFTGQNARDEVLDAVRLLDRLLIDVVVGTRSLDIFERLNSKTAIRPVVFHGMRRLSHSHTLLGLSKFIEFDKAYHNLIPLPCQTPCKDMMKIIESKRIYDFRSKYVAHVIDEDTGRPLNLNQVEEYIEAIFGQDETNFIKWVNDQKNIFPTTVVSVLEKTRDKKMEENGISQEEMNQG
jgi:hypothetical protein